MTTFETVGTLLHNIAKEYVINPYDSLSSWKRYCIIGTASFVSITTAVYFIVLREDNHRFRYNYQNANKTIPEYEATKILDCDNGVGECPIWDDRKQLLCWIDSVKNKFWTLNPKTNKAISYNVPEKPGSFCLCEDGSYLFAFAQGPAFYNPFKKQPIRQQNRIFQFETDRSTRMNDGRVDKYGRFVVGGMVDLYYSTHNYFFNVVWKYIFNIFKALSGIRTAVYRINKDLSYSKLFDDVMIANSICFGINKRAMYFTDSAKWAIFEKYPRIEVYEYYEDARLPDMKKRKIFTDKVTFTDGSIIDSEGYLWTAQVSTGKIIRFDRNGNVNMIVNVPLAHPTCCAFGGEDLDTLYITSVQPICISKWDSFPDDGALFAVKIDGVKGVLEDMFLGTPVVAI